ncbi:hypothetical protein [Marimonas lutisalis]|uniref:hypothetical protein n=1 Tax=Marimonas lutisalis TaxID=2545756 RepID=UPI0010F4A770|nr:hypothetical protein [Marimonas lutisalis]
MARFVIDLGDVELSREAEMELSAELQKVALGHVAASGAGRIVEQPFAIRFPHEWLGLILRHKIDDIIQVEKQLGDVMGKIR